MLKSCVECASSVVIYIKKHHIYIKKYHNLNNI